MFEEAPREPDPIKTQSTFKNLQRHNACSYRLVKQNRSIGLTILGRNSKNS
jgi:hypothetical protein